MESSSLASLYINFMFTEASKNSEMGSEMAEQEEDEAEETLESKIPKSHECKMIHGSKAITALAIDPAGSRLASG